MSKRLKILISAYACSPYQGSEPGVGWGFVSALAKRHDLWVIVESEKCQDDIERYLARNPRFGKNVHFHFLHKKRNRLLRKIWPPSYYWYYRAWHGDAYRLAVRLHREVRFDLAHQLTMVGYREPGFLWKLGIPFVWGPIGGMGIFPPKFLVKVGIYGSLYYFGYNLINLFQMKFLNGPKIAAKSAGTGLIAATRENAEGAKKYWECDSTVLCEVGLLNNPNGKVRARGKRLPLRVVWSGQHIPRKALNIGLEALALLPNDCPWELDIMGDGQCTSSWKGMVERLGLTTRCHFHGWLSRQDALKVMGKGHVLLITSLRDLTSTVTVEALSLGLPIVCLDHCGFADVVDKSCGIKIPVTNPDQVVKGMANALECLARDERLRQKLARGALRWAKEYTWDKKVAVLEMIYRARIKEHKQQQKAVLMGESR